MKSLAFCETVDQVLSLKLKWPVRTFLKISESDAPLKGGIPESRIKVITPADQTSHLEL